MVGVPGKYKGCETCRRRRVTCTNERPHCRKCLSSGRECEGYERERVFITGTPEGRGRVASHPPRMTPPKKDKPKSKSPQPKKESLETPRLTQAKPYRSAWDQQLDLSDGGAGCSPLITALHTSLHTLVRTDAAGGDGQAFGISLSPYSPLNLRTGTTDPGLWVSAQCLLCHRGVQGGSTSSDSYCVFLFEQTSPNAPWTIGSETLVKKLGPSHFTSFPNHQFFVRVYRPMAMGIALLNRHDTFISSREWLSVPWEGQIKSPLDHLFDLILMLPHMFTQTDQLILQSATLRRRQAAQDVLQRCIVLRANFQDWINRYMRGNQPHSTPDNGIPFSSLYSFRDEQTGFMMLYYWMAQLLFNRCIEDLYNIIFHPAIDAYCAMWPDLPANLQLDLDQFRNGRDLASCICRGLDSALAYTAQPDMLVAPMTVALDFYRDLQATSQDGILETLWLEAFKARLIGKGQDVASTLQGQSWTQVAEF